MSLKTVDPCGMTPDGQAAVIKPPGAIKLDDGRTLYIKAWKPSIVVGEMVTVVVEAFIAVPESWIDEDRDRSRRMRLNAEIDALKSKAAEQAP